MKKVMNYFSFQSVLKMVLMLLAVATGALNPHLRKRLRRKSLSILILTTD